MKKSKESFYKNLKIKLDESHIWPSKYVFKFIIKNNVESIDELISYFNESKNISKNFSSNKNCVTCSIPMCWHNNLSLKHILCFQV